MVPPLPLASEISGRAEDLNLTKMIEMLLSAFVHSMVIMTVAWTGEAWDGWTGLQSFFPSRSSDSS